MGARQRANVMPEIRGGLKRALVAMADSGRPLSTIWMELFDNEPAKAIQLAIAAHPKEMDITQDVSHSVAIDLAGMSADLLQEAMNARRALEAGDTEPDTPVH